MCRSRKYRSQPAAKEAEKKKKQYQQEVEEIVEKSNPEAEAWKPGEAPTQALSWTVESLAKAGTLVIIGVYPETVRFFPIGKAMAKNITPYARGTAHLCH